MKKHLYTNQTKMHLPYANKLLLPVSKAQTVSARKATQAWGGYLVDSIGVL